MNKNISIRQGVIRVRIEGGPEFSSAVELAIGEAAPDMAWLQLEGRQDQAWLPLSKASDRRHTAARQWHGHL